MIKCSLAKSDEDKIYYFPFDEGYDHLRIRPLKGEFFARTVREAAEKGFRRARKSQKAS